MAAAADALTLNTENLFFLAGRRERDLEETRDGAGLRDGVLKIGLRILEFRKGGVDDLQRGVRAENLRERDLEGKAREQEEVRGRDAIVKVL